MNNRNYDDIINLPRPVSKKHPPMSMLDRAAQFAPFRALSGHGEAVIETARYVENKADLGEDTIEEITHQLNLIQENIYINPEVILTYFLPDKRKNGGEYVTVQCSIKKIDNYTQTLILDTNIEVLFDDIFELHVINI